MQISTFNFNQLVTVKMNCDLSCRVFLSVLNSCNSGVKRTQKSEFNFNSLKTVHQIELHCFFLSILWQQEWIECR